MEATITNLVNRYERGSLTRRELIQGLTMLAGIGGAAVSVSAAPLETVSLDHVSLQAKDVVKTAKFYQDVFGLPLLGEDPKTKTIRLRVGSNGRIAIRQVNPSGVVDHFCLAVAHLNKADANEKLKQMGVTTLETGEPLNYHVVDPDGYPVQILSAENR